MTGLTLLLAAASHCSTCIAVCLQDGLHAIGICLDRAGNVIKQAQITRLADTNGAALCPANHLLHGRSMLQASCQEIFSPNCLQSV